MSSTPLIEDKWFFIGFTYNSYFKTGTFVVDKIYGFENPTDSVPHENKFFTFDTKFWLGTKIQGFGLSFRLGGRNNDFSATSLSFSGKMSCLQLHDLSLQPSQIYHQSLCPLPEDDGLPKKCPDGYTHFQDNCYKISAKEDTFSSAEYLCIDDKGDIIALLQIFPSLIFLMDFTLFR